MAPEPGTPIRAKPKKAKAFSSHLIWSRKRSYYAYRSYEVTAMRTLPIILFSLLATPALAQMNTANAPTLPFTPSGYGEPEAVVCRAPQALPQGGMGPKLCMRNSIWLKLTDTASDLSADGRTVFARETVANPSGKGHPEAVTCRRPTPTTASRIEVGPTVCLTNKYWASLTAEQKRINSYGIVVSTKVNGPSGRSDGIPVLPTEIH